MRCLRCKRLGHLCPDCDAKRNAAFVPVPGPASAILRRLHKDVNQLHSPSLSNVAVLSVLAALPALADLVKAVEQEPCGKCGWTRVPCQETPVCRALAGLREVLNANVP